MRQPLGPVIALGTRSSVHAWGDAAVAKVPLAATPEGWIRAEAVYTAAVRTCGAPVPALIDIVAIDGREAAVYERIDGPCMWDEVMARPADAERFGRQLADLHARILAVPPPVTVPSQRGRLAIKIRTAARSVDASLLRVLELIPPATGPSMLCHGDLHPKNIILGAAGPVVIDWFDVSRGSPVADIARTYLLLSGGADPGDPALHLPGADRSVLNHLRDSYLEAMVDAFVPDRGELRTWCAVQAAARLAEGVEVQPLLDIVSASCA